MIHIIQWLCPKRHCLLGLAYDPAQTTHVEAIASLKRFGEELHAAAVCSLCGSKTLKYEDRPTKFATMEEARPHLMETQGANMLARLILKSSQN